MLNSSKDSIQAEVSEASVDSRQLVLAGPGTGKTQTVAMRLVKLLGSGVGPAQILVLSFSKNAVKTLIQRLELFASENNSHLEDLRHISIRTFDSWSFRILRRLGYLPKQLLTGSYDSTIATLVNEIRGNRCDELRVLLGNLKHIIVDEFQDLSGIRGELVIELLKLMSPAEGPGIGFTVLGDEAQAIYGFSLRNSDGDVMQGPSAEQLLNRLRDIYKDKLKTTELLTNHRSLPNLASVATKLRSILSRDISGEKKLDAMRQFLRRIPEPEIKLDSMILNGLADGTTAILTRTNGEAIRVYQRLMGKDEYPHSHQIVLRAGSLHSAFPAWVGAILGPFQGQTLTHSQFTKIYNHIYPDSNEGIKVQAGVPVADAAWKQLTLAVSAGESATSISISDLRDRLGWTDLFSDEDNTPIGKVDVMTIHQSKGMEFDSVSILEGDELPNQDPNEEASVVFVALTRAAKVIKRIPVGESLYPLIQKSFKSGKKRWCRWRNGWVNLETGVAGDVSPASFVDLRVHESDEGVKAFQMFLSENITALRGRKVILCKQLIFGEEKKFVYGIYLQENDKPGRLLGTTTNQFTYDLLEMLWHDGYTLPNNIMNLRVMDVVTLGLESLSENAEIASKWSVSGLWLGVSIYGTGDFKAYKRS